MRDGRGVLVADGLAIEIAPVPANLLAFVAAIEKQGFQVSMRNNGSFNIVLQGGERVSAVAAYDNLIDLTGNCAAPLFVPPQGASNTAAYAFTLRCGDTVTQRLQPFVDNPAFYAAVVGAGLSVTTDRSTGIIRIVNVGLFKPSFFVSALGESETAYLTVNQNAQGLALRALDANGDGLVDYELLSTTGKQLLYGVAH